MAGSSESGGVHRSPPESTGVRPESERKGWGREKSSHFLVFLSYTVLYPMPQSDLAADKPNTICLSSDTLGSLCHFIHPCFVFYVMPGLF